MIASFTTAVVMRVATFSTTPAVPFLVVLGIVMVFYIYFLNQVVPFLFQLHRRIGIFAHVGIASVKALAY